MNKPNYYAVLTADVRYDCDLIPNAKLLYAEITALSNLNGHCHAGDAYFSNLFNVSNGTVQKWLKNLSDKGYIDREVKYKEGTLQIEHRYIRIRAYPTLEKECTPTLEKDRVNTTPNGDKNINLTDSNNKNTKREKFNFQKHVTDIWYAEAKRIKPEYTDAHIQETIESFTDYWVGEGKVKADWLATWRNWLRRSYNKPQQQRVYGNNTKLSASQMDWDKI